MSAELMIDGIVAAVRIFEPNQARYRPATVAEATEAVRLLGWLDETEPVRTLKRGQADEFLISIPESLHEQELRMSFKVNDLDILIIVEWRPRR